MSSLALSYKNWNLDKTLFQNLLAIQKGKYSWRAP